jgi:alkylation response protein AidB-like acyl-CoA dehydrogenase
MDFSIPKRAQEFLPTVRDFVRDELQPIELRVLHEGFNAAEAELDALRAKVKSLGLWAPQLPTELGGMGLDLVEHGMMSEALGHSPIGHYVFGCPAPDAGNMEILHKFGTDEQKQRWLGPLCRGEIRSCFSMTEPENAGSNPTMLSCRAEIDGDDFVINGHKWFTTAADGAAFAIVMAVTNPDADKHGQASMIIVPSDTPGFELVRNISIMGDPGEGWASHGEIRYTDVRVPRSSLLGGQGTAFAIAQERLGPGRIHHCMRWLGICERSLELMCQRAATRDMGGGKPLASKQIVQSWIAESRAAINAARLSVLHAAWKIENEGFYAAREEVSLIKFYVADVLMKVVDRAIQVHGAMGITGDTVLSYYYAHERGARIYDGPDEVHKMVVARRMMRAYQPGASK